MARVVKTDDLPEIIEIIDDDIDAFGERGRASTIDDTGGPRWIGPVAAGALAVLIVYGVATSASTNGPPSVAPASSTTVLPTTSEVAPSTTLEPLPPVPYYAADPPREFTVQYAEIQQLDRTITPGTGYQLWATEGASATTGTWFSIETYPGAGDSIYAPGAFRMQSATHSIGMSHSPSGQTIAQFSDQSQSGVMLTSFGLADDVIMRLADSISVDRHDIHVSDQSLLDGFSLLGTTPPWITVQGMPVEQVFYTPGNDMARTVGVSVSLLPDLAQGQLLDRQTALRFFLNQATPFTVDRHSAIAGTLVGQTDYGMATWTVGDQIISVTGAMPLNELISIAHTVHTVSAQEWRGMKLQATTHSGDNNFGSYDETDRTPVSFGTDANGEPWTIDVSVLTFPNVKQVNWQWGGNGFGTTLQTNAQISSVVDGKRTYVLADLPRTVSASANLQITRPGFDPVLVAFVDTDPELDRTFAAYAFSEATPYTAQIVGTDGTVVAAWPEAS